MSLTSFRICPLFLMFALGADAQAPDSTKETTTYASVVVFTRGALIRSLAIFADDVKVANLASWRYFVLHLAPGKHVLTSSWKWRFVRSPVQRVPLRQKPTFEINLKAGTSYYVEFGPTEDPLYLEPTHVQIDILRYYGFKLQDPPKTRITLTQQLKPKQFKPIDAKDVKTPAIVVLDLPKDIEIETGAHAK